MPDFINPDLIATLVLAAVIIVVGIGAPWLMSRRQR